MSRVMTSKGVMTAWPTPSLPAGVHGSAASLLPITHAMRREWLNLGVPPRHAPPKQASQQAASATAAACRAFSYEQGTRGGPPCTTSQQPALHMDHAEGHSSLNQHPEQQQHSRGSCADDCMPCASHPAEPMWGAPSLESLYALPHAPAPRHAGIHPNAHAKPGLQLQQGSDIHHHHASPHQLQMSIDYCLLRRPAPTLLAEHSQPIAGKPAMQHGSAAREFSVPAASQYDLERILSAARLQPQTACTFSSRLNGQALSHLPSSSEGAQSAGHQQQQQSIAREVQHGPPSEAAHYEAPVLEASTCVKIQQLVGGQANGYLPALSAQMLMLKRQELSVKTEEGMNAPAPTQLQYDAGTSFPSQKRKPAQRWSFGILRESSGKPAAPAGQQQLLMEASLQQQQPQQHSWIAWGMGPSGALQRPPTYCHALAPTEIAHAPPMHGLISLGPAIPTMAQSTQQASYAAHAAPLQPAVPTFCSTHTGHVDILSAHWPCAERFQSRSHTATAVGVYPGMHPPQQLQAPTHPAQPAALDRRRPAGLAAGVGGQVQMQQALPSLLLQQQTLHNSLQQRVVAAQIARQVAGHSHPSMLIVELISRCACMLELQQLDTVKLTLFLYGRIRSEVRAIHYG